MYYLYTYTPKEAHQLRRGLLDRGIKAIVRKNRIDDSYTIEVKSMTCKNEVWDVCRVFNLESVFSFN